MQRRPINITYTMNLCAYAEIDDYSLTEEEIMECGEAAVSAAKVPSGAEDIEWEWVSFPKAKDAQPQPPEDYWFETAYGLATTNNWLTIFKGFPTPENFEVDRNWLDPKNFSIKKMQDHIATEDFTKLPPHTGWFRESFRPIKDIPGVIVTGKSTESLGYVSLRGKLIAAIMPLRDSKSDGCFQFHAD